MGPFTGDANGDSCQSLLESDGRWLTMITKKKKKLSGVFPHLLVPQPGG